MKKCKFHMKRTTLEMIEAIDNDQETILDENEIGVVRDNIRDVICVIRGVTT